MKFTLDWLKTHLETDAPLADIAETLTALGLEVESVSDPAADLAAFVVAHVVSAEPHPDADKLRVCVVDTGTETVQVVCGAPNARAGMKGVFAAPGMTVPGTGLKLKKAKIRGVESAGMLCSAREMGLGDDHAGIIELPGDAPVGAPFAPSLGLDDPLIEIAITPDRPDCLGVRGIARDLVAAGIGTLKPSSIEPVAGAFDSPVGVRLDFDGETAAACPYFAGRLIRGVTNGASPDWLQDRLRAIGLRPISALVDLTNFFTYDLCRPLHVFDAATLAGSIQVRLARAGETVAALDGKTYSLDGEMTVIADDDGVLGLGGVIGGDSSACTETTTEVFVESAYFDAVRTAATGRKLGIESDARYRFERGIDPASCVPGLEAATRMILDLCGGEASAPVVAGADPDPRRGLTLRLARTHALGGLDLPEADARRILDDLGFAPEGDAAALTVTVPSWRPDIDGEADLVEEVVRVAGYDAVPAVPLPPVTTLSTPALDAGHRRRGFVRRTLAARGMVEAVTWSFMAADMAEMFGGTPPALRLANPISADLDVMRPSILPNLIAAAGRNAARGMADVALFEIGPQYSEDSQEGQATVAAGLRCGATGPRHWLEASKNREARAIDV
ncbi:MAG: phenylalanine--tRNA ligase subunit beta, partial [Alphaproteobacteria bacterium]